MGACTLGRSGTFSAAEAVALRLRMTDLELVEEAGAIFFPQPNAVDTSCYHSPPSNTQEAYESDSDFTMANLQAAIDHSNVHSAPGPNRISCAELRSLPTEY